jgi:hypothetical protein
MPHDEYASREGASLHLAREVCANFVEPGGAGERRGGDR